MEAGNDEEILMMSSHRFSLLFYAGVWFTGFLFAISQPVLAQKEEKEVPTVGGTYRKPLEFAPRTLDPALATDIYAVAVLQQLFDGLVQFDKNLNVIPSVARSWKISADGLTYTFYLREGVKFHHGREVTADDWVYSFTRIIDPGTKSPAASLFDRIVGLREYVEGKAKNVKGLSANGKYLFEIKLSEPYIPFLSILGMNKFKVLPREEVENTRLSSGLPPPGTGPFKFVSIKKDEEIILEANDGYFEGRPYLDRIVFKMFHGSPRKRIFKEFEGGHLDESFVPAEIWEDVARGKQYLFLQKPMLSIRFYGFILRSKLLGNKYLRKAIHSAIDKKSIVSEIHRNQFHVARGILPPGMAGYDPQKNPYPFDLVRAEEYLAKAGFPKGKGLDPLEFWSSSDSDAARAELNKISVQLKQIGISTSIHFETNWQKFSSLLTAGKTPVFVRAWYADFPDPDNFLGPLFHSKSRYNHLGYQDAEVDRLLDQAKAERDYLKRIDMYRSIEERVLEDAPMISMVHHLFQMAYQPYVRGVEVNALGGPYIPMKKIWFKKE